MAMEDESLAGVEAAPQGLVLNELAANETSLVALAKTLLSPRTLPHLALIVVSSTMLYFIANSDGGVSSVSLRQTSACQPCKPWPPIVYDWYDSCDYANDRFNAKQP